MSWIVKPEPIPRYCMAILAAVDIEANPSPLVVGVDLANAFDEPLVALAVLSESDYEDRRTARDELPEDFSGEEYSIDRAREDVANKLMQMAENGDLDTERIDARGAVGDPAKEILGLSDELNPRYVVVGGRKRSPAKQALFGSVSQEIVRKANQPVVTTMQDE